MEPETTPQLNPQFTPNGMDYTDQYTTDVNHQIDPYKGLSSQIQQQHSSSNDSSHTSALNRSPPNDLPSQSLSTNYQLNLATAIDNLHTISPPPVINDGHDTIRQLVYQQNITLTTASNTINNLLQNATPDIQLECIIQANNLAQRTTEILLHYNNFLDRTSSTRPSLPHVAEQTSQHRPNNLLTVPSHPTASRYSINLSNKPDSTNPLTHEQIISLFKETIRATTGPPIQMVAITKNISSVTITLQHSSMIEPAINLLLKAKYDGNTVHNLLDVSSITKSQYAVRTDKIPRSLIQHWFHGNTYKINYETATSDLLLDNKGWFNLRSDIESITAWESKQSQGHAVLLLHVTVDVYKKFLSTIPSNTAIAIGISTFKVYEEVTPTQCWICLEYGHKSSLKECPNPKQKCRKCSGPHKIEDCKSPEDYCSNCATNNEELQRDGRTKKYPNWVITKLNHTPVASICPTKRLETDLTRDRLKKLHLGK